MTSALYVEDEIWLGRVEWVSTPSPTRIGHLTPLAYLAGSKGPWNPLKREVEQVFPDRGRIFWHDVPANVVQGDLVHVRVERRLNYQRGEQEAFQVSDEWYRHACQVVDLRGWRDERNVRLALTGDGLDLALVTPHVYVRLDDATAVGAFTLERTAKGLWRLPDTAHEHVECKRLVDEHCSTIVVEDLEVRVLHDPSALTRPIGLRNWLPDQKLASGLIRRLRKLDREAAQALDVTDATLRQYVESHGSFLFQNDLQAAQEAARFQRVEELRDVVLRDATLLHEAAEALLRHPDVQAALDEPKEAILQEARREAKVRAENELERLADRLREAQQALDASLATRQKVDAEIAALDARLGARRAQVADELAAVEQELTEGLEEFASRPARLFAKSAILRALVQPSGPANFPAVANPIPLRTEEPDAESASDVMQSAAALTQALVGRGFNLFQGASMTAAFATGRAVVLVGESAEELTQAFADAFTGGLLTWIPVSPTTSDATQLLGHFDVHSGHYLKHPAGLLDLLIHAERDDHLHLVVLDGYDRAPAEHYLSPLLQCYVDARLGRGQRKLPILTPEGAPQLLAWPSNVLLACIPEGGPGALPLGVRTWRHAVLFDADAGRESHTASKSGGTERLLRLQAASWHGQQHADGTPEELAPMLRSAPTPTSSVTAKIAALYACARHFSVPTDEAIVLAFVGACLPLFRDADSLRRAAGTAFPEQAASVADRLEKLHALVSASNY